MKYLLLFCLTILSLMPGIAQQQTQHRFTETKTVSISAEYQYLLFTPTNEELKEHAKFPLIVFLHGAGERGDSLNLVKVHGPPKIVETNPDFPFIVLSPQCAANKWWEAEKLDMLIDDVVKKLPVDESRIYLTGLSMGGFGTWDLAQLRPDRFAAIAPICGGSRMNAFRADMIKDVPTWAFHGAMDYVVPLEASSRIVASMKRAGSDVKFTIYPMAGHDSWTETYNNPELYTWFRSHKIKK